MNELIGLSKREVEEAIREAAESSGMELKNVDRSLLAEDFVRVLDDRLIEKVTLAGGLIATFENYKAEPEKPLKFVVSAANNSHNRTLLSRLVDSPNIAVFITQSTLKFGGNGNGGVGGAQDGSTDNGSDDGGNNESDDDSES